MKAKHQIFVNTITMKDKEKIRLFKIHCEDNKMEMYFEMLKNEYHEKYYGTKSYAIKHNSNELIKDPNLIYVGDHIVFIYDIGCIYGQLEEKHGN